MDNYNMITQMSLYIFYFDLKLINLIVLKGYLKDYLQR